MTNAPIEPQAPPGSSELPEVRARPRRSRALLALLCVLCGALLYVAHSVFIPVALSMLFALVLSSPVEALHRLGLPRTVGAVLIMSAVFGLIGAGADRLWEPAQLWLAGAPHTANIITQKIGPVARILRRIDLVTERAAHLT